MERHDKVQRLQQHSSPVFSLHPSPLLGSSLPDNWESQSTESLWLTAWSQTPLHTREGQGQAPGAGEEKPLHYQESDAAGPHTPVTPGHPNVASFCAHAQGCTTKPAETKSNNTQTSSHSNVTCTTRYPKVQLLESMTIYCIWR